MKRMFSFREVKLSFLIAYLYLRRKWKIFLLLFLAILVSAFLLVKFNIFNEKESISEGFIGTYQEHDLPFEVTQLLSSGLVETDKNGRMVGKLVSGWETNNDATQFKFKLKDNLKWSDGSEVKSSDLLFNIPNIDVSFPDEKTVQFKLKESYSPFPSLLTKPIFKKGTLIGIGPYKLSKIEKSRIFITKLTLETLNEDLPKVFIRFYPNEKIAKTGFSIGEVQSLLAFASTSQLDNNPKLKIERLPDFGKIVAILYNTQDSLLGNKQIRQALSYSINQLEGESYAQGPIPPYSWAYNGEVRKYLSDAEGAKSALEKAKSSVSEEILKKELILTSTPQLESVAKSIVSSWVKLGFDAKLRIESGIPQNFQALLITQSIPVDPDQYSLWHSTQDKTNLTKYSSTCCSTSARVDKDLEDGRKVIVEEERRGKYIDFQKVLMEDPPATFLYFPKYNLAFLKKVEPQLKRILPLQLPFSVKITNGVLTENKQ